MDWKPTFEVADRAAFDKYVAEHEYCQEKKRQLDLFQLVDEILSYIDTDCLIELRSGVFGLCSFEYNIQGSGYADLFHLAFKCITNPMQRELIKKMMEDYEEYKREEAEKAEKGKAD